jgi:hypothetical protein
MLESIELYISDVTHDMLHYLSSCRGATNRLQHNTATHVRDVADKVAILAGSYSREANSTCLTL